MNNYIFTSESVSDGHPDKVADQISDALVDAGLKNGDETTRTAIETLVTTNMVTLAGEVKNFNVSKDEVDDIVRQKVKEIGYEQDGFHYDKLEVNNYIHSRSAALVPIASTDPKSFPTDAPFPNPSPTEAATAYTHPCPIYVPNGWPAA
mgnify:CR=1 FL=1